MRGALSLLAFFSALTALASDFSSAFSDSTLRIDYVLSGTPDNAAISLKGLNKYAHWAGRRHNLEKPLYAGNADVTVTSLSGDTLYANSFSSLFNEWLDLGLDVPSTGDCPVLVPMPKQKVKVTARLLDRWHKPTAVIEHVVDPEDILIRNQSSSLPYSYVHKATYDGPHIGVAFLAEGYTAEQMDEFFDDAKTAAEAILGHKPFDKYADRIDFIAVPTPSAQSGVSVPKKGLWLDTAFGSHYSTFYSDRYLTSPELFKMYDALANVPAHHIIILANTPEYGGGGIYNSYTLSSSKHPTFHPVIVHEFGHSFGGLADEYFYEGDILDNTYPLDAEPWEPNITTLKDFGSKWEGMIKEGTPVPTPVDEADKYPVGVYEGGGYSAKGVYRPADVCRMRVNEVPEFCPVCQKALQRIILFYTEPLQD